MGRQIWVSSSARKTRGVFLIGAAAAVRVRHGGRGFSPLQFCLLTANCIACRSLRSLGSLSRILRGLQTLVAQFCVVGEHSAARAAGPALALTFLNLAGRSWSLRQAAGHGGPLLKNSRAVGRGCRLRSWAGRAQGPGAGGARLVPPGGLLGPPGSGRPPRWAAGPVCAWRDPGRSERALARSGLPVCKSALAAFGALLGAPGALPWPV